MSTVKLLAVFSENKTGQLARVAGLLAQASINIRWVTIVGTETFGVIKLLVNDCQLALNHLKYNGLPVSLLEALAVEVQDKPGGLLAVAECLAQNQINIENASGLILNGRAVLLIEAPDLDRAEAILKEHGFRLASADELISPH